MPRKTQGPETYSADDDEENSKTAGGSASARSASFMHAVTRRLAVSLEELFFGFHKRLKVARRIEDSQGNVTTSSVILTINGLPGWRHGTALTFSQAGDRKFGFPAQDVTIIIEEEPHPVFQHQDDNLIMNVQVPLFNALYGHTEHIETIDGKKINVPISRVSPGMCIVLPGEGMPDAQGKRGDLILRYRIVLPPTARASIRAVASLAQGPTDWRDVPMPCATCHELYSEVNNSENGCFVHQGHLVGAYGLKLYANPGSNSHPTFHNRNWSCCRRPEASIGCACIGRHRSSEETRNKARASAACNGLLAAAKVGDPYATAWFMLDCSVLVQLAPIRAAISNGHFLATLLFVRDGADLSSLGGPTEALQMAAMHDKELASRLLHVMEKEKELFELFATTPGAPQVAFAHGCRQSDIELCQRLLLHPRVGPTRCGVMQNAALAARLLFACGQQGNTECCRVLIDAGVDVNALERNTRRTALHYAAEAGHLPIVEMLLSACVRTNDSDLGGKRPLDLAMDKNHGEIVVHLETAMLEEALLSMAGLTLLRLFHDATLFSAGQHSSLRNSDSNIILNSINNMNMPPRMDSSTVGSSGGATSSSNSSVDGGDGGCDSNSLAATTSGKRLKRDVLDVVDPMPTRIDVQSVAHTQNSSMAAESLSTPISPSTSAQGLRSQSINTNGHQYGFNHTAEPPGPTPARPPPPRRKSRRLRLADLRPSVVVLEDALRSLCSFSESLSSLPSNGTSDPVAALECYSEWRVTLGGGSDVFERNQAARMVVDAMVAAGVALKAKMQEQLCTLADF